MKIIEYSDLGKDRLAPSAGFFPLDRKRKKRLIKNKKLTKSTARKDRIAPSEIVCIPWEKWQKQKKERNKR